MKKLLSFLLILTFVVPVFSQKLYLDLNDIVGRQSNADLTLASILEKISPKAKEYNIEIIDYNSLDLIQYTWNFGVYEKKKSESEKLADKKKDFEK